MQLHHRRIHQIYRAGACPVLEVALSYPHLSSACLCAEEEETEALPPAAIRFNEFYETLAERLLSWAEGTLRTEAMADFAEEGSGAVYRFDRRCLTCDMTARLSPSETEDAAPTALVVTRALAFTSRRGSVRERCLSAADVWRWPELTLRPPKRRTEKAAPPARDVE